MASCPVHSRQWEPFVPKLSRVPLDGALLRRRTPATGGDGEVRKMALKYVRTWPDALTRKEVVSLVNDHVSGLPGLVFLERAAEFATAAARAAPRAFYGGDGRPGISAGGISPFLSDAVEQLLNEGDVVADAAALAAAEASPRSAPPSARSPRSRATALSSDASRGALVAILRFLACCDSSSEYKRTSAWKRCRHLGRYTVDCVALLWQHLPPAWIGKSDVPRFASSPAAGSGRRLPPSPRPRRSDPMAPRLLCVVAVLAASAGADDTKRVKDPVVRHDARQCGQYLCPAYPNAAEKYILDGCGGEFESYMATSLSVTDAPADAAAAGVSTSTLVALATASGLVACAVGFLAGKRGGARPHAYLPVRTKGVFDFETEALAAGPGYQ